MTISVRLEQQPRIVRFPGAQSQEALEELANSLGAFVVSMQLPPHGWLANAQAEFALQIQRAALVTILGPKDHSLLLGARKVAFRGVSMCF